MSLLFCSTVYRPTPSLLGQLRLPPALRLAFLLLFIQQSIYSLAAPLENRHPDGLYELSYELHRPTGVCTLLAGPEIVGERTQRKVERRAGRSRARGSAYEHPAQSWVWIEETEMVSQREQGREIQAPLEGSLWHSRREWEVKSSVVSIYSFLSGASSSPVVPKTLFDLAELRAAHESPRPARLCTSWTNVPGRRASLAVQDSDRFYPLHLDPLEGGADVPSDMELVPLMVSGPTHNRVNVAFFGDGYTLEERDKFLADVRSLTTSIVEDGTFDSTAPLFNFWGVFVPSRESGVGSDGEPNDTPFGLYRDGHELRALYAAHRRRARAACRSIREGFFGDDGGCDYAALIGNTDLYGGLGGEFTITTASRLNGALVLRHEIGHSLIKVGEEYEGGYAYFGVNSSPNFTDVKWSHWLTTPEREPRSEDAATPLQAYPWFDLEESDWSVEFETEGKQRYPDAMLRFSVAGLLSAQEMVVTLDNVTTPWSIPPKWLGSPDRAWIEVPLPSGLAFGAHSLSFALNASHTPAWRGHGKDKTVKQICSVEVSEYGRENVFERSEGFVGAFPTRSMYNTTTYRPTNEGCLMRMVGTSRFCSVCQEGLWGSLLEKVRLIDEVVVEVLEDGYQVSLSLPSLAHLRPPTSPFGSAESYTISWSHNLLSLPQLANQTDFLVAKEEGKGEWRVEVTFESDEIRSEEDWTSDAFTFTIS